MPYLSTITRDHRYPIVARKTSNNGGEIIIAERNHAHHPFVVWHMYADGSCEGGGYYSTRQEANRDFASRP